MSQSKLGEKLTQYFDEMGQIAFHYTSVENAINIINTKSIWLRYSGLMNDALEITHGSNLLRNYLNENQNISDEVTKCFEKIINDISDIYFYIASFLNKGDYLPAWRYYGDDGKGVAIGLKKDSVKNYQHLYDFPVSFAGTDIIYDTMDSVEIIDGLVKTFKDNSGNANNAERHMELLLHTILLLPMFKHYDFKDENEWRILTTAIWVESQNKFHPDSTLFKNLKRKQYLDKIEYRFEEISSITFGPCCDDYKKQTIKNAIEKNFNEPEVKYIESKKPYRGKG